MPSVLFRARPQGIALALVAVAVAGCSSEATRFTDSFYTSQASTGDATGSVPVAPAGRIEQSQLAPPPGASRPATSAPPAAGISGGGRGMASYQPATTSASEVTGSLQGPRRPPDGQWSRDGGIEVTVAHGDTIEAIARRHNVPASAILQANGLTHASTLHPGQRLMIPRHSVAARSPAPAVPNPPAPARTMATPVAANGTHIVASGDTLSKIARKYGKSVPELARANNLEPTAPLKLGDRLIIPGVAPRATASKAQPKTLAGPPPKVAPVPKQQANNTNEQPQQTLVVSPPTESPAAAPAKSADAGPSFRWPVKGRIIAGFGPKPNGQQNDGINVSVPEGTPIKAAEDGVVAYSGNELKGYGNLVLVRHPNGYVTAYAHAKELNVKRGDQIKRGQVIGKAGQTGDVDAPQLHFEVRKGPTPLDPMGMLNGG